MSIAVVQRKIEAPDEIAIIGSLPANRRRDRIKILYWEIGGFSIWYRRLESGTLENITGRNGESVARIDATELSMLLSGISLQSVKRRNRFVA